MSLLAYTILMLGLVFALTVLIVILALSLTGTFTDHNRHTQLPDIYECHSDKEHTHER